MLNLIQADLFKLRKSMSVKIILGITTISSVIMSIMAYQIQQGNINQSMVGIGFMFSDMNMMSILGAVIAGVFICGDFDNKSMNEAITNGYSRIVIIVSKSIVFSCAIGIILLPYAIITGIALSTGLEFSMGSVSLGFLNILTSESGTAVSTLEIWKLLAIMVTLIIVYVAQLSLCVPLAFTFKKPVFVIAFYNGFTILCAQLIGLTDSSKLLDNIYSSTPYGGNYTLLTLDTATGDIFKAICVSLFFISIMIAVTYSTFRRAEIK